MDIVTNETVIETTDTETEQIQEVTTEATDVVVKDTTVVETKPALDPKKEKDRILREMSKEYGVNLYSAEGLAKFKEFQDANKTEQEKLQDQLNSLTDKETEFKTKEESYQATIAALQLGIDESKLNDAIALAKINMTDGQSIKEGLAAVQAKYGDTFSKVKGTKAEVVIGTQQSTPSGDHVEVDPALARYLKNKKK